MGDSNNVVNCRHCNVHLVVGGRRVESAAGYELKLLPTPSGYDAALYHDGAAVDVMWSITAGVVSYPAPTEEQVG